MQAVNGRSAHIDSSSRNVYKLNMTWPFCHGVYSRFIYSGTGDTGTEVKMWRPRSISSATALKEPPAVAAQRTDPAKSDLAVAGNASSMLQEVARWPPEGY